MFKNIQINIRAIGVITVILGLMLTGAPMAFALNDDRLWLSTKHRGYYLKLKEAALAAEALDRCEEVLRGTLDLDLSEAKHPVYRILCREPNGVTYSELVDGLTMEPQSQVVETPPPETRRERELRLAEEAKIAEQQRILAEQWERFIAAHVSAVAALERAAAEKAQEEAQEHARAKVEAERTATEKAEAAEQKKALDLKHRKQAYEEICQSEILARTSMMMNLKWVTDKPILEELENGQLRFYAEFDAQNMWGAKLQYQAMCTISTPAEFVVVISPR